MTKSILEGFNFLFSRLQRFMNRTRFLAIVRVISRSYVVNSLPDTCRLYIFNLAHTPDKQLNQFICVRID